MMIPIFNGSPRRHGNTAALFRGPADHLAKRKDQVEYYDLYGMDFKDCSGCMTCKKEEVCAQKDGLTPIYDKLRRCDALVIGSPTYMSAETATTKARWIARMPS